MNSPSDKIAVVDEATGHVQYFEPDAHRALVAIGLVWRAANAWHAAGAIDMVAVAPELAVCDFCSGRPVIWDIDAAAFALTTPQFTSLGGWAACDACGRAIVAGDRGALLALSVAGRLDEFPASGAAVALSVLTRLHDVFWQHFRGITRL